MSKEIIRKIFVNSRNKQLTISLSKKEIKVIDPTIKFGENLFAKLRIFMKKKGEK